MDLTLGSIPAFWVVSGSTPAPSVPDLVPFTEPMWGGEGGGLAPEAATMLKCSTVICAVKCAKA